MPDCFSNMHTATSRDLHPGRVLLHVPQSRMDADAMPWLNAATGSCAAVADVWLKRAECQMSECLRTSARHPSQVKTSSSSSSTSPENNVVDHHIEAARAATGRAQPEQLAAE